MIKKFAVPILVASVLVFTAAVALSIDQPGAQNDSAESSEKNSQRTAADSDSDESQTSPISTETLGGADRYLAHLSTDKPIYRPGETVYLRGVLLHAFTRKPLPADQNIASQIEIEGPKGDVVHTGITASQDSVFGFSWKVPAEQAGGEYTFRATFPGSGHAPTERKFDIRNYRAPRLKTQIVFVRDGYGPGDVVAASASIERAEGGIPAGAQVEVQARVDGELVYEGKSTIDASGLASTRFELPKEISRGEGTLAFIIEDGGVVETATKTIPILLQTVDLEMFPEGGDLIAGVKNRVYLSARTPAKKPADIAGAIVDQRGRKVVDFRTEHEGRGRFEFTPRSGQKYTLLITEPAGIKTKYELPPIKPTGAALSSTKDVFASGAPIALRVASADSTFVGRVTLSQREKVVAEKPVKRFAIPPNRRAERSLVSEQTLKFDELPESVNGVLIATLWNDKTGDPVAERLIFRQPKKQLRVSVTADRPRYTPGGQVELTVKTTDADGQPVSSVVGLTVTDDSVLEMIEKREQAPRLPVMVFLEGEVKELADAHVYLDPDNSEAPRALDLLLGTQGWRRFAFVQVKEFVKNHDDLALRVLALRLATPQYDNRWRGDWSRFGDANGVENFFFDKDAPVDAAEFDDKAEPNAVPEEAAANEGGDDDAGADEDGVIAGAQQQGNGQPPALDPEANQGQAEAAQAKEELSREVKAIEEQLKQVERRKRQRRLIGSDIAGFERMAARQPVAYVVVREYAHQTRADRQPGERIDFTETLYWHAGVKTDPQTGEAKVKFGLSDAVTSFRVSADGFTSEGVVGADSSLVESVEPFYVEPKLPLEVTSGDRIELPIAVVNATTESISSAHLTAEAEGLSISEVVPITIGPDGRIRQIVTVDVGEFHGATEVILRATGGPHTDNVTRPLVVQPFGFPIEHGFGGMLYPNETAKHEIVIPQHLVKGSLQAKVAIYPTPLANLTEALERLIREPYGCFEQTSSTTYPLVMAQQYFQSHTGVDPQLIERSNAMLEKGYNRLIGFECEGGGFEWFGQSPAHEALTAYGLLEFSDMSQVRQVDSEMLSRATTWLLGQRDGNGGFKREQRTLHTWLAEPEISNAYITWALLSAGVGELDSEVEAVRQSAETTKNSYVLALAANVMILAGRNDDAIALMDRLVKLQSRTGVVEGATVSIVGSGGDALAIETTALATLAWLTDREYADFADAGIRYLTGMCKGGRFGSTQSTVLALKAIVEQDKVLARPKAAGSAQVLVDGKPVGKPIPFDRDTQGAIEMPDISAHLTPGKHIVEVKMTEGSSMPYSVAVTLSSNQPDSSPDAKVHLDVSLKDRQMVEGGVTEATVVCENFTDETVPTPVAIIGLPGGLEVRHDQLKELVKAERIAAYEVRGREVILYWRAFSAKERVELPLSLVASIPGEYNAPASRAYLYYTDEDKHWTPPLTVAIRPRQQ